MDIDSDPGLLVVDLEHCVPSDGRHLGKSNCVYATALPSDNCHEVIELGTPVQCLSDISQSLCRIQQQQHLTQLEPIHYQQLVEVTYDNNGATTDHGMSPLYHANLHNFSPTQSYSSFLSSLSPPPSSHVPPAEEEPPPPPPPPPPPAPPLPKKKFPPPDLNNVPRFPINEYEYYKEIEQLLVSDEYPPGVSDNYKGHLRKRAQHYLIIDNELYHNPTKPKKVIMRKEDQKRLLEYTHVSSTDGIHLGIMKMLDNIHNHYFWRGLYEDVASFVNSCPQCRDNIDLAQKRDQDSKLRDYTEEAVDDPGHPTVSASAQTVSPVWSMVEVQVHGPFKITTNHNEFIVTITDPVSCFVQAAPLPRTGFSSNLTEFLMKTFYTFGFPKPYFIGDKEVFNSVSSELDWRVKQTAWKTKLIWRENPECSWVAQLVDLLIIRKTDRWDKEMDKFMFQFRNGSIRDAFFIPTDAAPFYSMFYRVPYNEEKENFNFRKRMKAKMHKNPIKCEQCDDIFTSKVLYRHHNKRHLVEKTRNKKLSTEVKDSGKENEGLLAPEAVGAHVEVAMDELKNYLAETKEIRRKRGKYQKYSVEIQEHMISYALKHGTQKASSYFTQLIGSKVSDSTIRNLLRSCAHFQPRVKQDIARYAVEHGVEKASKHFTETLKKDVSVPLVKKFKAIYGSKFKKKDSKNSSNKNKKVNNLRNMESLTDKEKEEVGCYAYEHSLDETIKYFLDKMKVVLNENEVQDCQKLYLDKQSSHGFMLPESGEDLQNITYQTLGEGNVCFSPSGSIVQIEDGNFTYQSISYRSLPIEQEATTLAPSHSNATVPDQIVLVPHNSSSSFEINVSTHQNSVKESSDFNDQFLEDNGQEGKPLKNEASNQAIADDQPPSVTPPTELKGRKKKKKENSKKRGTYTTYSPELRAKIGKYAAENGSIKASTYFSKLLGRDIPESTARGLKEKYLSKVRHCDVTSLGYSPRGRPLRLGKYDEVVQDCLKELVRSGERLTSFLAITTAKQILSKLEPSLLKENGGTIVLNTTWAKSFLKRIGVRNNS